VVKSWQRKAFLIYVLFYVNGSVYRRCVLIIVKLDATQSSLFVILQVHSTCFGCQPHQSSGIHKTAATSLQRGKAQTCWREVAAQQIWPVPEAVVKVLCTLDDGCGWHPKHVEWTCRIINRPHFIASRWAIINMSYFITIAFQTCFRRGFLTGGPTFSFAWPPPPTEYTTVVECGSAQHRDFEGAFA